MSDTSLPTPHDLAEGVELQAELLSTAHGRRIARLGAEYGDEAAGFAAQMRAIAETAGKTGFGPALWTQWAAYARDAGQRGVLTLDLLRQRGEMLRAHAAAGSPPVLIYDYEVVLDGRSLPRPSNYMLLRITPPEGVTVHDWKRPYVIIDPRAGHGAGIGGFKTDSQVGVALADGHPVYFVAFHPEPLPDQTIADVTASEAEFLREISRRHPDSPKPIVVGNCQGGWATAILAATHPDLPGPIVLNGAPMSYWGGKLGQDPMRYGGGLSGGVLPALLSADLGGGTFDGASLVQNFEMLNPGRTWFRKYYDLFADPETGPERFLDFEKWWGSFYLMSSAEIRWIIENLFVGNKLGKNEAFLEPGRPIDLRRITSPIIVFASHGDNITPPAQALNWIIDTYTDETEIEIRGQRILYMVHEDVGHLGIFVSSSVARREHSQMASTLKTIEALTPGLYEMQIEDKAGEGREAQFTVSFSRRTMADLAAETGGRRDEAAFTGVARLSEGLAEWYDLTLSPLISAAVTPQAGRALRRMNPMRLSREATGLEPVEALAEKTRRAREEQEPLEASNPFLMTERLWADMVEQGWNMVRDAREAAMETGFLSLWSSPLALWFGQPNAHDRARRRAEDLRALPEVQRALARMETGGLAEATIRILVMLANSRGEGVRRDRLERSSEVLTTRAPFADLAPESRAAIIHEQGLIAHFEPEAGLATLSKLLHSAAERKAALEHVRYILGEEDEMDAATRDLLAQIETVTGARKAKAAK